MSFTKYPSIENSYQQKMIAAIKADPEINKEPWVVLEKIHGANFSFNLYNDGKAYIIRTARRSAFDNNFHSAQSLCIKYGERMALMCSKEFPNAKEVTIFGEIYGGDYPHESVEQQSVSRIQSGVFYCPTQEFAAFDIRVDGEFIDHVRFLEMCILYEIMPAPQLFVGTFEECLAYENTFLTWVPGAIHGLPTIEGNYAEGVVIKPLKKNHWIGQRRAILKNKSAKFSEVSGSKKRQPSEKLSQAEQAVLAVADLYINDNRLDCVLSKVGEYSKKEVGVIFKEFAVDALSDFEKDQASVIALVSNSEYAGLVRRFTKKCSTFARVKVLGGVSE